jgi:histidinol-phosphate aminotransferase
MALNNLISAVFRKEVLAMSAYHVANAKGLIKLDAMENPYNWPEDIKAQWLAVLKDCPLNRYPDPEARQLLETLRLRDQISKQFDVLLGNGSDEIILLLLMALNPGASVLAADPGFVMYKQLSQSLGLNFKGIPLLDGSFELDVSAMLAAIEQYQPAIIFLAYPNNPTGNLFNEQSIHAIIKAAPGLVVIDEAYAPFADASFLDKLGQYNNLLVMRTLSKLGLAGLRLGYIVGHPAIIGELNKIRLPYNINSLTQLSADFALSNNALFDLQTQKICAERALVLNELGKLQGLTVYPSAANFILFKTPENQATRIFESIKSQGVLIKNLSSQGGLLADCLRGTIGQPEENTAFLTALKNSMMAL